MKLLAAWEKLKPIDDPTPPLQQVQATESPAVMPCQLHDDNYEQCHGRALQQNLWALRANK